MKFSEKQFLQIPYDVIEATHGHPIDAMVYGYIAGWENSLKASRVELKTSTISEFMGVSDDTIGRSIKRLVSKGLVGTKLASHGIIFTTRKDVIESWQASQNAARGSAKCGATARKTGGEGYAKCGNMIPRNAEADIEKKVTQNDAAKEVTPTTGGPSYIFSIRSSKGSKQESLTGNSEREPIKPSPLEAAAAIRPMLDTGPNPRARSRAVINLTKEQTGIVMQVFGVNGEERRLAEVLTDEQAANTEFIDHVLRKLIEAKKAGRLKSPYGLFRRIVADDWRPGWTDPKSEQRRESKTKFEQWLQEQE